ncbi:MAG: carbohydrate kinase family protein [bacterium]
MARLHGVGCALMDYLYTNVDFSTERFRQFLSVRDGDGGLSPGRLTFADDFARFAGMPFEDALREVVGDARPDSENLGGPAIVAMVHAAQLTAHAGVDVAFTGVLGDDAVGRRLREIAAPSGVDLGGVATTPGRSPSTIVLSDPDYADGQGERTFINDIAAAWEMTPDRLDASFFAADVVLFGGTALVPRIHDALDNLTRRAREAGALTVCGTVYDFRNQQRDPSRPWPLGHDNGAYPWIDLLITDQEEILRLTGARHVDAAVDAVLDRGVEAVIVTRGAEPAVAAVRRKGTFAPLPRREYPVSAAVARELAASPDRRGDTTGCGDNFVGGVLGSLLLQIDADAPGATSGDTAATKSTGAAGLDLHQALLWGVASGGFTCFYAGGTYHESAAGEKRALVEPYVGAYAEQLADGAAER